MSLDLHQVALNRLITSENHEFYTKMRSEFFSSTSLVLFNKIEDFYKANTRLPTRDELLSSHKDDFVQDFLENEVLHDDNEVANIEDEFLISQLQDHYVRDNTLTFLDDFLENIEEYETVEIVDNLQNHILKLNNNITIEDECFDVGADLDIIPKGDSFVLHTSGLSDHYDAKNGGFARQELVMLGGRRGSGKSIISLNCANHRYKEGNTVAFFTIEMRYKEVHDRLMSGVSKVPFLDIYKNEIDLEQKVQIARSKMNHFYEKDELYDKYLNILSNCSNEDDFRRFETTFSNKKPQLKENRLFLIDDESLTISRIDHYCNLFKNKYPNFNMAVVDYINIIAHPDKKDWKAQIELAESLKTISRRYDLTLLSPYQIDESGEARFAKGILDSADRSFIFFPPDDGGTGIKIHTSKIRNGAAIDFDVDMDWETVSINPNRSNLINESINNKAKYGSKESEKDLG